MANYGGGGCWPRAGGMEWSALPPNSRRRVFPDSQEAAASSTAARGAGSGFRLTRHGFSDRSVVSEPIAVLAVRLQEMAS